MRFEAVDYRYQAHDEELPRVRLERVRHWNDLGYRTTFNAWLLAVGQTYDLGQVKILRKGQRITSLPSNFESLDENYVSLGQSEVYYATLRGLGEVGTQIQLALRDATVLGSSAEARLWPGFDESVLRFAVARGLYESRVTGAGDPREIVFTYQRQFPGFTLPHRVDFRFSPSEPLSRVVVLVGENGTGKTALLGRLAFALTGIQKQNEISPAVPPFPQVMALSFNAFDDFPRPERSENRYYYAGLRDLRAGGIRSDGGFADLNGLRERIRQTGRESSWRTALRNAGLSEDIADGEDLSDEMLRLSCGQKFALFVLTHLFAALQRGAMVLFDEPEIHSHPQMLTGILRAFTSVLHEHDAFAVIATHSPLVLQEFPANALRIIEREGSVPVVSLYPRQSFGAPLDELVRIAFRLSASEHNFVEYLERAHADAPELFRRLSQRLGEDAPLLVRALIASLEGTSDA